MSHVSLQDAQNWLELNGNGVLANENKGISLQSIANILESNPDISFAEIKRLSNTDPGALTSSKAAQAISFQEWARDMLSQYGADNNTLTFFIDRGGNIPFNGDPRVKENMSHNLLYREPLNRETLTPGEDIVGFIRQTMDNYEELTEGIVRFKEVDNDDLATISFYYSQETPTPTGHILGLSASATNGMGDKWRNIFYSPGGYKGLEGLDAIKNTIVHEMGHTLGLSHPYDYASQQDNDVHAGKGLNSVYNSKDTIMSYNRIDGYRHDLTDPDENAYRHVWQSFGGSEDLASPSGKSLRKDDVFGQATTASGRKPSGTIRFWPSSTGLVSLENQSRDYITGLSVNDWYVGDQSDDTWHGGEGNDEYFYKGGFDFASGGDGEDIFYIDPLNANGYLTINDFTDGQDKLVFQSDDDYSIFAFGGATFVLASDTDKVVFLNGEFTEQQLFGDNVVSPLLFW